MPNWFWVSVCLACFRPKKNKKNKKDACQAH